MTLGSSSDTTRQASASSLVGAKRRALGPWKARWKSSRICFSNSPRISSTWCKFRQLITHNAYHKIVYVTHLILSHANLLILPFYSSSLLYHLLLAILKFTTIYFFTLMFLVALCLPAVPAEPPVGCVCSDGGDLEHSTHPAAVWQSHHTLASPSTLCLLYSKEIISSLTY